MIYYDILLKTATDIIIKCDSYFVTKCDRSLLQNASEFLLQNATTLLQNATGITNCGDFITKCDSYYKMRRLLPIATVHKLSDSTMRQYICQSCITSASLSKVYITLEDISQL